MTVEDIFPHNITKLFFFLNCKGLLFPRVSLYFVYSEHNLNHPTHSNVSEDMPISVQEKHVVCGGVYVCVCFHLVGMCRLPPKSGFHFLTLMSHSSCPDCYKQVGKYLL